MLRKKVIRDLQENKGAYIACITIIVLGLVIFTSFSMVIDNLHLAQTRFYNQQNFADGFAEIQAIPYSEMANLKKIKGIDNLQGRLVKDVKLVLENQDKNIYLRLISLDPTKENTLNKMMLSRGIPLNNHEMNIWVDNKFFTAQQLELDQEIAIIASGKKRDLRIVGMGKSPEYIYALRTANDLFPTPETFGIAWMPLEQMKTLFDSGETINNIVFTLKTNTDYKEVEELLIPELKPYGLKNIFARKDQTSHLILTQEIQGLEAMARSVPLLFLAVAGMILYIMLKRMVQQQRGQIGILKAFGYTCHEIRRHYLSYALVIGTIGGIIGGLLGIGLSFPFTALYQTYFNMPGLNSQFSLKYFVMSILLSLVFATFAGYQGCKQALSLQPAEAMHPPAPKVGKKTIIEKISFFWQLLTVQGKMGIRNMTRNPGRSLFILLGIAFTFSLLALPWSMKDLSQQMIFDQFEKVETYDVKVALFHPLPPQKITWELSRFPGVKRVETRADIPVTLKHNWYKKDVVVMGLPQNSHLYNILDKAGHKIEPPQNGILISERLAKLLHVEIGQSVTVESLMMKDPKATLKVTVVGIVLQYLGLNGYMEVEALNNLLGQKNIATSIMLRMNESAIPALQKAYNQSSAIDAIDHQASMLAQIKELMASTSATIYVLLLFGIITGFTVVYNSAIITLSERNRELASMMVMGMTPTEVLSVITFEQWFIGFFAMLLGIPLTQLMLMGMAQSVSNDVYSMPTEITAISLLYAFLLTSGSIWLAQKAAAQKIKSLDLVEVLKSKE